MPLGQNLPVFFFFFFFGGCQNVSNIFEGERRLTIGSLDQGFFGPFTKKRCVFAMMQAACNWLHVCQAIDDSLGAPGE